MEKVKAFIENRDLFGVPIGLKHKGKSEYQTFSGGLCSIIILVLITFLAFTEISKVWNQDFTFSREQKYNSLALSSNEMPLDTAVNKIRIRFWYEGS